LEVGSHKQLIKYTETFLYLWLILYKALFSCNPILVALYNLFLLGYKMDQEKGFESLVSFLNDPQ